MWMFLLLLLLMSCEEKPSEKPVPSVKELFRTRGCTNCHDLKKPLVGPPFEDIATRYGGKNREELVKSVLNGSCGKWKGRMECMPPQRISEGEARAMIEWIISLPQP